MRVSLLIPSSVLLPLSLGNLLVDYKIELNCNRSSLHYTGCLTGMRCDGERCIKPTFEPHSQPVPFYGPDIILPRQDEQAEGQIGSAASQNQPVTTDGTCGGANGDTVCGDWEKGSCCSLFGVSGSIGPDHHTDAR